VTDSRATRVTLFEDRAEVVREATADVPAGVAWVTVTGLSLFVDDSSLVASTTASGARVIGARIRRTLRQVPAADPAEIGALEAELVRLRGLRVAADWEVHRLSTANWRTDQLVQRWEKSLARVRATDLLPVRRAREALDADAVRHLDGAAAAKARLEQAQLDEARAEKRLAVARTTSPRYESNAEVQVESDAARSVPLSLLYRVPAALWRPEHAARLVEDKIELATVGVVWQATGEDWSGVTLRLSTARPTQQAAAPLVIEDRLHLRKKADKTVHVEARDQTIAKAGVAGGTREVDEMPGVDDGGEPRWYESLSPVSVRSDGQPMRVALGTRDRGGGALEPLVRILPAAVERVAYPEQTIAVHRKATATLTGGEPLLAGPVRLARGGTFVGRGKTGFISPGEPFELGFGADDTLRVRRRVDEERETGSITGRTKLTRTVHLYVSNLGTEAAQLVVVERIPVSEIGDVSVELVDAGGGKLDAKDGFVRLPLTVPPRDSKHAKLAYKVEWGSKVQLSL
jgi:uncharacterized protein (TIGR02231 family)